MNEDERERCFCGDCKYFKVNADMAGVVSTCKRIDHKKIQFHRPWYKSYDCNQYSGKICSDFEPADWCTYKKEHWDGFDNYWNSYKKYWNHNANSEYIQFFIDEDKSVAHEVSLLDFVFNTMFNEDGSLKVRNKLYYKRSKKSPTGYELVIEKIEGGKYEICK